MVIVILITSILASTAMWNAAGQVSKTNDGTTRSELVNLRTALEFYAIDNIDGTFPAAEDLEDALSPYLNGRFPTPRVGDVAGISSVKAALGSDPRLSVDDRDYGWVYCHDSGEVVINSTDLDANGVMYADW